MPVNRVAPLPQSKVGAEPAEVVDVEIGMRPGMGGKPLVEPPDKAGPPPVIPAVAVAKRTDEGQFKIVLYDRAGKPFPQTLPNSLEPSVFRVKPLLRNGGTVGHRGKTRDVAQGGVDENELGAKPP